MHGPGIKTPASIGRFVCFPALSWLISSGNWTGKDTAGLQRTVLASSIHSFYLLKPIKYKYLLCSLLPRILALSEGDSENDLAEEEREHRDKTWDSAYKYGPCLLHAPPGVGGFFRVSCQSQGSNQQEPSSPERGSAAVEATEKRELLVRFAVKTTLFWKAGATRLS